MYLSAYVTVLIAGARCVRGRQKQFSIFTHAQLENIVRSRLRTFRCRNGGRKCRHQHRTGVDPDLALDRFQLDIVVGAQIDVARPGVQVDVHRSADF